MRQKGKEMDKLGTTLAQLAEKLGTSVEKLWPALLDYVVVQWWTNMACASIAFAIAFATFLVGIKGLDRMRDRPFRDDGVEGTYMTMMILGGIVSVGALVFVIAVLSDLPVLWHPEVYALRELRGLLH